MSPIIITPGPGPGPGSSLQVGRLLLGPPPAWTESVGDPIASQGGAVVPGARTAPQFQVTLATWAADGQPDTLAARQTIRRQLRAMLNNTPLKLQGFLYVVYSDDPEQNGWYVPDAGQLTDMTSPVGLATGLWQIQNPWDLVGHRRTSREAREVWMKDLRTGLYPRDTLGLVFSTDFSALPGLQLTVLPNGATVPLVSASGQVLPPTVLPTGRDSGTCGLVAGPSDMTVISYDRPEAALNLSDVICYDRRGQITAPTAGPDTSWEEVYGPDYPWNWLTSGQPQDTPVLDNGLVRVRYDATSKPGFRVDVWNGSAYVEQGKMIVVRIADSFMPDDTWLSASLIEYTPDRAVMKVVLTLASDLASREQVYVTVQRGQTGVRFEVYPALAFTGSQEDVAFQWSPALSAGAADLNNSIAKIDSQGSGGWTPGAAGTAAFDATAGTGTGPGNSGTFTGAGTNVGSSSFATSENWAAILRCPTAYNTIGAYQTTLIVQQAANANLQYLLNNYAYAAQNDSYQLQSQNAAGYLQCQVTFAPTQSQQVIEAESMTLGTGTSSTVDSAASGGTAATATRTTDSGAHVTQAAWPNSFQAAYRMFARVKVSAGTGSFYAKTGASTGTTLTTTSTSYVWVDLGEITANATTLELHAWISTGTGTVSVDRLEAVLVQDQVRSGAQYYGSRDQAQAALFDSRTIGALVARS